MTDPDPAVVAAFTPGGGVMITLPEMVEDEDEDEETDAQRFDPRTNSG